MPKGVYSIEGRRKAWTPEERMTLVDLIERGRTPREIAAQFGRSTVSVETYCKRTGVSLRKFRPASARAVARMLGVEYRTVVWWIAGGRLKARRSAIRAGTGRRFIITEESLYGFLGDRRYWSLWTPDRIVDRDVREWAADQRSEQFLSLADVASRYHVVVGTVGNWLDAGLLPHVRLKWNRQVPASSLNGFSPPSEADRHGRPARRFTADEDAHLLALRNGGATWAECEYQLHRAIGSCVGRYARLTAMQEQRMKIERSA